MDLGIGGKTALVCGASKGLGYACAEALVREGVNVVIVARGAEALDEAAEALGRHGGGRVEAVAADITTGTGQVSALAACDALAGSKGHGPDILVTNAGGPPPGDFREWDRDTWIAALDANMLTPIALMRATVDNMMGRRWGRIINITSSTVKAPSDYLGLSNGARAGLTGFVAGLAREVIQHGVTLNNLLPGSFETDRLTSNMSITAQRTGVSFDQVRDMRIANIPARRFGMPAEFGATCAYLCSEQAAFINAQNILIDGGAYRGTL